MTEPGGTNGGFYGLPWSFLIIEGILCGSILFMVLAARIWPHRWGRLLKRLGDILNRLLDSKRKDNNWGKWTP